MDEFELEAHRSHQHDADDSGAISSAHWKKGTGLGQGTGVDYTCSCGSLVSLFRLYHCRYCIDLRCSYCTSHEIEVYYPQSNLREYKLASDARESRCRSTNTFGCPLCGLVLQFTRLGDDKTTFYLACPFCHWSSKNTPFVGTEEGIIAAVQDTLRGPPTDKFNEMLLHYKAVAAQEVKASQARQHYDTTTTTFRKTRSLNMRAPPSRKKVLEQVKSREQKIYDRAQGDWVDPPAVPTADALAIESETLDDLLPPEPSEYISSDISKVSSLQQRLELPHTQPASTSDLSPHFERLTAKISKRCLTCQHNVIRPDLGPDSHKFKIFNFAYAALPRVSIVSPFPKSFGTPGKVFLKIENPRDYNMKMSLSLTEESEQNLHLVLPAEPFLVLKGMPSDEMAEDNPSVVLRKDKSVFLEIPFTPAEPEDSDDDSRAKDSAGQTDLQAHVTITFEHVPMQFASKSEDRTPKDVSVPLRFFFSANQ